MFATILKGGMAAAGAAVQFASLCASHVAVQTGDITLRSFSKSFSFLRCLYPPNLHHVFVHSRTWRLNKRCCV